MGYKKVTVLERRQLIPRVVSITVPWDESPGAGQFFMLRAKDAPVLLPRAISVCEAGGGKLRFLVQTVGPGTGSLAALREGDVLSVNGPLGNGFPVEQLTGKRVLLAGGGIGVAPMVHTARALKAADAAVDVCAGFRDQPFLLEELRAAAGEVRVSTETGRQGHKGYITAIMEPARYDAVLVCGPEPMMKAAVALCIEEATPVYVSLENRMACGLGACLVCTCTDRQGRNRRTCKDGPVFRGEEIDFDA